MAIAEFGLHCVMAHRLERLNDDVHLADLEGLLAGAVAHDLGRWRIDPHQLKRNTVGLSALVAHLQQLGFHVDREA